MEERRYVGKGQPRLDGREKAAGRAIFASDLSLPGQLVGKILTSTIPSGRIKRIDTGQARLLSGVAAVITGRDVEGLFGPCVEDRPILAKRLVRFAGEPVVAVAAENDDIANKALSLIEVEYEPLPFVTDEIEAMAPDAPLLHSDLKDYNHVKGTTMPEPGTNACQHFRLRKGDVESAFAEADYVLSGEYRIAPTYHACLETHVAIARYDSSTRSLEMWCANQSPYVLQRILSKLFGIPRNRIQIHIPWFGGGFGSKIYPSIEPIAVALAQRTGGRPVKLQLSREEDFLSVINHGATIRLTSGVNKDGRIIARKVEGYFNTGAYADCGPLVARNSGFPSPGPYNIPNLWVDTYAVYTNLPVATAFRGYGVPQVTWAYEKHMDEIAAQLGLEPLEFRLRNILREGQESPTGEKLVAVGLEECIKKAAGAIGWTPGKRPVAKQVGKNLYRGYGIACTFKASQRPYSTCAYVRLLEDGSALVGCSIVDMGQGASTIFAQIAAQELGIDIEKVTVLLPDTGVTPYDRTTSASRGTFQGGNAVRLAAQDVIRKLAPWAARVFGCDTGQLEFADGYFYYGTERLTLAEVIEKGIPGGTEIVGESMFFLEGGTGLEPETGQGERPTSFWMYGAHVAEVDVDIKTGRVYPRRIIAAHDVGRAINPLNCSQQIEGGLVMGLGSALTEELKFVDGKLMNGNLHDYKLLGPTDIPRIETILVEKPHPNGPYGAKGLGEPPVAPPAPAVANAVQHAVGVILKDLPFKPEAVLAGLKGGKNRE